MFYPQMLFEISGKLISRENRLPSSSGSCRRFYSFGTLILSTIFFRVNTQNRIQNRIQDAIPLRAFRDLF
ncbi:MAG: hypothetical protein CVU78_05440 [Elusimicrobia bacterium HGW-Elusimicrobia-2]|nr:MAG: hypothetical protein CVU78_05440 [Elusimicrobia bacterium HGW-Elusimicrobia-2]